MNFMLKDIVEIILSLLVGMGVSFHFTKTYYAKIINQTKQIQKNNHHSKDNIQIGNVNVTK